METNQKAKWYQFISEIPIKADVNSKRQIKAYRPSRSVYFFASKNSEQQQQQQKYAVVVELYLLSSYSLIKLKNKYKYNSTTAYLLPKALIILYPRPPFPCRWGVGE